MGRCSTQPPLVSETHARLSTRLRFVLLTQARHFFGTGHKGDPYWNSKLAKMRRKQKDTKKTHKKKSKRYDFEARRLSLKSGHINPGSFYFLLRTQNFGRKAAVFLMNSKTAAAAIIIVRRHSTALPIQPGANMAVDSRATKASHGSRLTLTARGIGRTPCNLVRHPKRRNYAVGRENPLRSELPTPGHSKQRTHRR